MKTVKYLIWFFAIFLVMVSAMPSEATKYPSNGVIHWKGQNWFLPCGQSDPGNNCWDNTGNGVWIDKLNRMHLTIKNNKGVWKCTELDSQYKYLYGTFTWTVASPVYTFDKNSVVGLFTYINDCQELDIEMSRWGETKGNNLWFSAQPYTIPGNSCGYKVPSKSLGINTKYIIDWQPDHVRFTAKESNGKIIADYNYTNVSGIPQQPESVIMNLWLTAPPSNGKNIELIISDFTVTNTHPILSETET